MAPRRHMVARCSGVMTIEPLLPVRTLASGDRLRLAEVMLDAYRGTVDAEGDETFDVALAEVDGYFAGASGPPLLQHSRVAVIDDEVVSAALVSDDQGGPLIAYMFTAADWKRRHLAEALLRLSMRSLAGAGRQDVQLWVTRGNPAERLYERLGFVEIEDA